MADMHVGSLVGLWKPYITRQGVEIRGSRANAVLLEYWNHFWSWAQGIGYDTVLLLGDLAEGQNKAEFGRTLTTPELERQIEVAAELLAPHVKGKRVHAVTGSPYHSGRDIDLDKILAGRLGAKWHGLMAHLEITGTGKILQIAHGTGGGTIYRETAMGRTSMFLDMIVNQKIPHDVDLVVRGHLHWFGYVENERRGVLQCPGWKLWFPWGKLIRMYGRNLPTIGAVILEIDRQGIKILCPEYKGQRFYPYIPFYDALEGA